MTTIFLCLSCQSYAYPKIAVAMLATQDIQSYAKYSIAINTAYAKKHLYTMLVSYDRLPHPSQKTTPHWDKINWILVNLNQYDYILWVDADAIVINFDKKIEEYIDDNADIVIAHDMIARHENDLNTGVMLIKNSEWSKNFLQNLFKIKRCSQYYKKRFHEQSCLEYTLDENILDANQHIKRIPSEIFNDHSLDTQFIYHLAGMPTLIRISVLQKKCNAMNLEP